LRSPVFHDGEWQLLQPRLDEGAASSVIAHAWRLGDDVRVVVVNLSKEPIRFEVAVDLPTETGASWSVREPFSGNTEVRTIDASGFLVLEGDLRPWGYGVVEILPAASASGASTDD
jgi:hypothetical protein